MTSSRSQRKSSNQCHANGAFVEPSKEDFERDVYKRLRLMYLNTHLKKNSSTHPNKQHKHHLYNPTPTKTVYGFKVAEKACTSCALFGIC